MNVIAAFSIAIRMAMVLALIGFVALGSLTGPVSAATGDHHAAAMAMDEGSEPAMKAVATCPGQADSATHEMEEGSCCVGTCMTILGILGVTDAPAASLREIEPSDHPVSAQGATIEFLRPPSLTI